MKTILATATAILATIVLPFASLAEEKEEGFKSLFNGESLEGWEVAENKESFKIEDGAIVAHGTRAHAFYVGDVGGAKFKNFELRLEAMTRKSSNGGVFIHTKFQEKGWPSGYEIQVNNTQSDPQKTGGIYATVKNLEPFEDDKWMEMVIRVEDGKITSIVNGKKLVEEYTPEDGKSKLLPEGGAIALQAHDPGSKVYYRNIRIKILD